MITETADVQLWSSDTHFLGVATGSVTRDSCRLEAIIAPPKQAGVPLALNRIRMVAVQFSSGERFVGIVDTAEYRRWPEDVRLVATDIAKHVADCIIWPGMCGYEYKPRLDADNAPRELTGGAR